MVLWHHGRLAIKSTFHLMLVLSHNKQVSYIYRTEEDTKVLFKITCLFIVLCTHMHNLKSLHNSLSVKLFGKEEAGLLDL